MTRVIVKGSIDLSPTNYTPSTANDFISHLEAIDTAIGNIDSDYAVGEIIQWPTDTIPSNSLQCDGSAVSRTTYATLYALIGTMYGSGDGTTTFNLPDYRGRFLRGVNSTGGTDPDAGSRTDRGDGTTGDAVGTKQAHGYPSHTHGINRNTNDTTGGGATKSTGSGTGNWTNSNGGNESRPYNKYAIFCIIFEESS